MYRIPTTLEGEARAYEDDIVSGATKPKYKKGGSVTWQIID